MATIQGHQCDHCGRRVTEPYSAGRQWPPTAKSGYYLSKALGTTNTEPLWFCNAVCVVGYLTDQGGD